MMTLIQVHALAWFFSGVWVGVEILNFKDRHDD